MAKKTSFEEIQELLGRYPLEVVLAHLLERLRKVEGASVIPHKTLEEYDKAKSPKADSETAPDPAPEQE